MCAELLSATPINMFPYSSHTSTPYTEAQWIPNTMVGTAHRLQIIVPANIL